ncbi:MAG TPA: TolC family outer membrane protein [Paracoccaceae bacterium]|nr:TolC family outer membrane protein [Paracoccaceae bacterium]
MADSRTRRAAAVAVAALVCGVLAGPSAAETLADALVKAWRSSPDLMAGRAQLRALDEREFQARAERFGTVDAEGSYSYTNRSVAGIGGASATGRNLTANRDDADPLSLGLTGSIPIYTGGRIENRSEAAERAVLGGREFLVSTEQQVLLDAVTAYEDVRRDIALVEVARSNVRVISEQLRAARDRFEVGEVTRTDVSQAEARLAAARSTLAATTGALARSRQAYLAAVGEPPEDLQPPPPLPELPATEAEAIALADARHPDLQRARLEVERAEANVKVAISGLLPQVSLGADATYTDSTLFMDGRDNEGVDTRIGLNGRVPLWTAGRNPSAVREAQARVAEAQADVHAVARTIRRNVSNAWSGLQVARASIVAAREQIRAAQLAFDGVREEATLGARTTLDVLDADQELQRARADLIQALRDEYVAGYSLLSAVGSLTAEHLGLAVEAYDPDDYPNEVARSPYEYPRDGTTEWSTRWRP